MPKKFKFKITRPRKVRYRYTPFQQTLESNDLDTYVTYGMQVKTVEEEV